MHFYIRFLYKYADQRFLQKKFASSKTISTFAALLLKKQCKSLSCGYFVFVFVERNEGTALKWSPRIPNRDELEFLFKTKSPKPGSNSFYHFYKDPTNGRIVI